MKPILITLTLIFALSIAMSQNIRYVTEGGTGDGLSWATASNDIQAMMDSLKTTGGQVWVAEGVYKPKYKFTDTTTHGNPTSDRDNSFLLVKDVELYGGFAGYETSLNQRVLLTVGGGSILSGDIGVEGDSTDNCYHIVISAGNVGTACLDGFVITGGNSYKNSHIVKINNYNVAVGNGGGIYNTYSSPKLRNLYVYNNYARGSGGGIFNLYASPVLINVFISHNYSYTTGGGMYSGHAYSLQLTNVVISDNTSRYGGGGVFTSQCNPIFTNITVAYNKAGMIGGGIRNLNSDIQVRNAIIWGNTCEDTIDNIFNHSSNPIYANTLFEDMTIGNGIISNTDPLFFDTAAGDYRLQNNSPAASVGNAAFFSADSTPNLSHIATDVTGNPRIIDGMISLGAYQNLLSDATLRAIKVDDVFAFPNPDSAHVYEVTLPYRDSVFIELITANTASIAGGRKGKQAVNIGLNSFSYSIISEDYKATSSHKLYITLVKGEQYITFLPLPEARVGDADFSPNATVSSGLEVTYSSSDTAIAEIVSGLIHIKKEGTTTITAQQPGNENYKTATPVSRVLTVKPKVSVAEFNQKLCVLYPNPVKDVLYVESAFEIERIAVYDINGKLLKQVFNKQNIEINDLAKGIYFANILIKNKELIYKFIKK